MTLTIRKGNTEMRVTKTIKEYINEKVEAAYAAKRAALPKMDKDFDAKIDQCEKALQTLRSGWEEEAKAICAKYGFAPDTDWRDRPYAIVTISHNFGNNARKAIREAEADLNEEIRKAAQDIIVEMELGGDRAKLDEMLAMLADRVS